MKKQPDYYFPMLNNIKTIRESLDLSQAAFAEGIGSTQGNVSHYECQRQEVSPEVARKVIAFAKSRGVEVTFDDIYTIDPADADEPKNGAAA